MADAVQVLDHRYPGVATDAFDQPLAAARHDHIDVFRHADQRADRSPVSGLHDLHRRCRQPGFGQAKLDAAGNGLIGMDRLGTTSQDGRVARLHAQAGGVDGHVRPRLVDDPDHAQRHAHLADLNARRHVAHVANLADRVRQRGDLAQPFDHAVDHLGRQRKTIEHRRVQTVGAATGKVPLVGADQLVAGCVERGGGGLQGTVLLRRADARKHPRGLARGAAQAVHVIEYGLGHGSSWPD